LLGLLP